MNAVLLHVVGYRATPTSSWTDVKYPWLLHGHFDARPAGQVYDATRGGRAFVRIHGEAGDMLVAETVEEIFQLCDGRALSSEPDKKT